MIRLLTTIALVGMITAFVAADVPDGFVRETIVPDLNQPTALEFLPDGRMLIAQRTGELLLANADGSNPVELIEVDSLSSGERGVHDIVLAPDFARTGHIYVHYTHNSFRNRVTRLTLANDLINPFSEVLIWENPDNVINYHHGGSIDFDNNGYLFIATGDQVNQLNAQDGTNLHGKILRLHADGSIPKDNPFVADPMIDDSVWALGLRNPWRFTFDDLTDDMWIADVGGNGAVTWEEINFGVAGANYGWPDQEGDRCSIADCSIYELDRYNYAHTDAEYATLHINFACIIGGPVYRATQFPPEYRGNLFIADHVNFWVRRLVFDEAGNIVDDPVFATNADDAHSIVDMQIGPDGSLYIVDIGREWATFDLLPGKIDRYRYEIPKLAADLNGDGCVNQADLGILLSAFGLTAAGDIDGDGATGQSDLGVLLAEFSHGCDVAVR